MGFFSNLFKRNKPKMIEAPKEEERKETNGKRVEETEIKPIQDEIQITDDKSQDVNTEDKSQDVNTEDKRKVIICQFAQALKEYDDWYSTLVHDEEESYRGAIDIIPEVENEMGEKADLVILNYKSAITKKQEKVILAIAKVPEISNQKYLRKSIDEMIYEIYNNRIDNDLHKKMDEIKSKIFGIEFTYEGSHLLLNKGGMVDKTVEVDIDSNGAIMDYKKLRQYNTFKTMGNIKTVVEIEVRTMIEKLDERDQKNYVKQHYINDIINLEQIAENIGLIKSEISDKRKSKNENEGENENRSKIENEKYTNALRDAMIIVKNSAYAQKISRIDSESALLANEKTIKNSLRDIIGDTIYYENVIEEEINKRDGNDTDRDILIKILAFGKSIMAEREEIEKNRVRNANEQNGFTVVTVNENKKHDNTNSETEENKNHDNTNNINSETEEKPKTGTGPKNTGAIDFRESVRVKKLNGQSTEKDTSGCQSRIGQNPLEIGEK